MFGSTLVPPRQMPEALPASGDNRKLPPTEKSSLIQMEEGLLCLRLGERGSEKSARSPVSFLKSQVQIL